jgi:DNA polymerase-3 subunit delta'
MSVWSHLRGSTSAERLEAGIASGDIAHAWLLLGPSGSGKRVAATCLAAAVNCTESPGHGCGSCSSCLRTLRHRHPDAHHIVPEGPLIPVDTVRDVLTDASRSPFEGRYKVFVIEEADRMNPSAQNALLKTLEEPQPDTIFALISDREEELLDTIRSRCRVLRLDPVPEAKVVELLEHGGASGELARLAARVSGGDLPRARGLAFETALRDRRRQWLAIPDRLTDPRGSTDAAAGVLAQAAAAVKEREASQKDEVTELAEAMGEGRGTAVARNALAKRHKRELKRLEEDVIGEALSTLATFYRDVLACRCGGEEAVINLDVIDELTSWSSSTVGDAELSLAIERLVTAGASFVRNANPSLAVESALVEVGSLAPPPARVGTAAS